MQAETDKMQAHMDRWLLAALLLSAVCCSAAEDVEAATFWWTRRSALPTLVLLASMPLLQQTAGLASLALTKLLLGEPAARSAHGPCRRSMSLTVPTHSREQPAVVSGRLLKFVWQDDPLACMPSSGTRRSLLHAYTHAYA
jgi:hypothetical protein